MTHNHKIKKVSETLEKPRIQSGRQSSIVIAITGATGAIYGIRLLQILKDLGVATHLIISSAAQITIRCETSYTVDDIREMATYNSNNYDLASSVASGSFQHDGMIVAPCSAKTLSAIAHGFSDNLIARAADVTLKERRRLVLMFRETPLNLCHIESMRQITLMGGIVAPPMHSFYIKPQNIDDLISYTVARVLDLFDIKIDLSGRWCGLKKDLINC